MSHPIVVQQLLFMLKSFLPAIGCAELAQGLAVSQIGEDEYAIEVGKSGIGIDTGFLVPVSTLAGAIKRPGFRVFTMEVQGGSRWHPPEDVDVTHKETLMVHEVLVCVASLLAKEAVRRLPDFPEELRATDVAEDQVF
ncbi:MAG TPA: hypothetical protein VJ608_06735 [Albitalea sp.]|nr:hypothetical protein [Albitalea sp.]